MATWPRLRGAASDASGAVADLGVLIPIVAALVLRNGMDPATVLVGIGALYVGAGAYFGVPVPVQPIKAAAAIAIARGLPPATIAAAGVALGVVLLVVAASGAMRALERIFAEPIVRGLQLGVGLILIRAAYRLQGPSPSLSTLAVGIAVAVALVATARRAHRFPLALALVAGGVLWSIVATENAPSLNPALWRPSILRGAFDPSTLWSAITLLVIPQIPLTLGNAVVGLVDVERRYFGERSRRVTSAAVGASSGIANVATCALGGMPMCHGSGGLTAHVRAGARTKRMNFLIGGTLLVLGLTLGPTALGLLALIPAPVLMGFLAFTGAMHAALVADQRGWALFVALVMGVAGAATSNLAIALGVGFALWWPARLARR